MLNALRKALAIYGVAHVMLALFLFGMCVGVLLLVLLGAVFSKTVIGGLVLLVLIGLVLFVGREVSR
ncbi:hypothetical protein HYV70_03780 [Candidatus Uhrbacteria bacterium]|nr:hypothetical protein [Candidatus Uhrbacteria bacterium]